MELTGSDRSLHLRTREAITERMQARVDTLISSANERDAGYIQGLRDALRIMDGIAHEMAEPKRKDAAIADQH